MKCPGCGKVLKTPDEQIESIRKLRESGKKVDIFWYIKWIVVLVCGYLLYRNSDAVISFVRSLF